MKTLIILIFKNDESLVSKFVGLDTGRLIMTGPDLDCVISLQLTKTSKNKGIKICLILKCLSYKLV